MLNSIAAAVIGFLILGPLLAPGFKVRFCTFSDFNQAVKPKTDQRNAARHQTSDDCYESFEAVVDNGEILEFSASPY